MREYFRTAIHDREVQLLPRDLAPATVLVTAPERVLVREMAMVLAQAVAATSAAVITIAAAVAQAVAVVAETTIESSVVKKSLRRLEFSRNLNRNTPKKLARTRLSGLYCYRRSSRRQVKLLRFELSGLCRTA